MKEITVAPINSLADLPAQQRHAIDVANWADFPSGPATTFAIGRLADRLCISFDVAEQSPRSECTADFDPVYQDSCVEFFCRVPGAQRYINFEFNSAGVALASRRVSRNEGVEPLSPSEMCLITREPSATPQGWRLTITIPLSIISPDGEPAELECNLYKCGDECAQPHFLTWNPIVAAKPDFHRPECFGRLKL